MIGIKIQKCSDSMMWYSNLVGKTVPLIREIKSENCYLCREPTGYSNIVLQYDGTIVEEECLEFF